MNFMQSTDDSPTSEPALAPLALDTDRPSPALSALASEAARASDALAESVDWDAFEARLFATIGADARETSGEPEAALVRIGAEPSAGMRQLCDDARGVADGRARAFEQAHDRAAGVVSAGEPTAAHAAHAVAHAVTQAVASTTTAAAPRATDNVTPLRAQKRARAFDGPWLGLAAAAAVGALYLMRPGTTEPGASRNPAPLAKIDPAGASESPIGAPAHPAGDNASELTRVTTDATVALTWADNAALQVRGQLRSQDAFTIARGVAGFVQNTPEGSLAVAWVADASATPVRATVAHAAHPLVVVLGAGAVEAEVTPVAAGEAYAVDVGASRVAVHGTHLRVARIGGHVTVDLAHGEIAIGRIPEGFARTVGRTVRAPAHVEFDADAPEKLVVSATLERSPLNVAEFATQQAPLDSSVAPAVASSAPHAATTRPTGSAAQIGAHPGNGETGATPGVVGAITSHGQLRAEVQACVERRALRATGDVGVSFTSDLELRLKADGTVQSARFSPPLEPAAHECAAAAIYRSHFDGEMGTVHIPVHVQK